MAQEQNQAYALRTLRLAVAKVVFVCFVLSTCWVFFFAGCGPRVSGDYVENISSAQPDVATDAMSQAAEKKSTRAIVPLVQRLYDEDPVIRLSAIRALKQITGQDFGYRYYEPEVQRVQAIKRWQAWVVEQSLVATEEQLEPSE
jgi:hypothetical protein